jgi:hypothetical protein
MRAENLQGQLFHEWIVIDRNNDENLKGVHWNVKCMCGECEDIQIVSAKNLKRGTFNKLCSKRAVDQEELNESKRLQKEKDKENKTIEREQSLRNRYNGMIFGNLLVLGYNSRNKDKLLMYDVECQCDNKTRLIVS